MNDRQKNIMQKLESTLLIIYCILFARKKDEFRIVCGSKRFHKIL